MAEDYKDQPRVDFHTVEQIAKDLGGDYSDGQAYVLGPGHSSVDRGLAVSVGNNGKLLVHSHHGDSYSDCVAYLSGRMNGTIQAKRQGTTAASNPKIDEYRIAQARKIWDAANELTGTCAGSRYLKSRSLGTPYRSSMRFHPVVPTKDKVSRKCARPAIVSCIRHAYGDQFTGIHITFIEADGNGKAKDVETPRRMLGKAKDGGIWPDTFDTSIVIAEGIESALSAERQFGTPAVVALSTSGMKSLYVPFTVRTAIIIADNDEAGVQAALAAARRLMQQGVDYAIYKPAWQGKDANDIQLFAPVNNLISVNRKAKPLLDATIYGNGVSLVPVAPFIDEFIQFGVLKAADPKQPEWPRASAYFDLLRRSSLDDEVYSYGGGGNGKVYQIALRQGDLLAAQDYLAKRWNTSRNSVRGFLKGLIDRGLVSDRRPETPSGKIIRTGGSNTVPDVLELPKVPLVPVVTEQGFSLQRAGKLIHQRKLDKSHQRKQTEKCTETMGYNEVPLPVPPTGFEHNPPQSKGDVEEGSSGLSADGSTRCSAPLMDEWFAYMPPASREVPWYGVPPELRQSVSKDKATDRPSGNRPRSRKRAMTPKGKS